MPKIKAQKALLKKNKIDANDIIYRFCFFYPQYTVAQARQLPFFRVKRMLTIARQEQARECYNITRIQAIVAGGKKTHINKLLEEFKNIIES